MVLYFLLNFGIELLMHFDHRLLDIVPEVGFHSDSQLLPQHPGNILRLLYLINKLPTALPLSIMSFLQYLIRVVNHLHPTHLDFVELHHRIGGSCLQHGLALA